MSFSNLFQSITNNSNNSNRSLLIVSTSVVAVVVTTTQVKPIQQIISAILGRIHLNWVLLTSASGSDTKKTKAIENGSSSEETTATVSALYYHPVKSLKAVPIDSGVLGVRGFVGDRQYMIVAPLPTPLWGSFGPDDPTHRFISQRQCPILTQITVTVDPAEQKLVFSINDNKELIDKIQHTATPATISIPLEPQKALRRQYLATIWGDTVKVQDMGDDISAYLNSIIRHDTEYPDEYKQRGVRLVIQCPDDTRTADNRYIPGSARSIFSFGQPPKVALSDGFPILVTSEESLNELNCRLVTKGKEPLPMSRFRPNIILRGLKEPFVEDRIRVMKVGDAILHVVKGCPRCKESCTDQDTGKVTEEPLATLQEFRALNKHNNADLYFGQNALIGIGSEGKTISVGDKVTVLQWGEPTWDQPE